MADSSTGERVAYGDRDPDALARRAGARADPDRDQHFLVDDRVLDRIPTYLPTTPTRATCWRSAAARAGSRTDCWRRSLAMGRRSLVTRQRSPATKRRTTGRRSPATKRRTASAPPPAA